MSNNYQKLSQAYNAANLNKKGHILQEETNVLWREIKKGEKLFDDEMKKLKERARKSKATLLGHWANVPTSTSTAEPTKVNQNSATSVPSATIENKAENNVQSRASQIRPSAHAQQKVASEIADVEKEIADLYVVKRAIGLSNANKKCLDSICKSKRQMENKLKRLRNNSTAQNKKRKEIRNAIKNIMEINPQVVKTVKPQGKLKAVIFGIILHIYFYI